jgi:polyphosphate kinase
LYSSTIQKKGRQRKWCEVIRLESERGFDERVMQNLIEELKVAAAEKNDVLYCGVE